MENTGWQLNSTDTGYLDVQCTGLGGGELDKDWEVLLACRKEAHVYGPSLSKQEDWKEKAGTIAGTAHTQEYLLLHLAMFPIGLHTWCHVLGMPAAHQLQAQIIYRARKPHHPSAQEATMVRIQTRHKDTNKAQDFSPNCLLRTHWSEFACPLILSLPNL